MQDRHHIAEVQSVDDPVPLVLDIEPHVERELAFADFLGEKFAGGLHGTGLHGVHVGQFGALGIVNETGAVPKVKMKTTHRNDFQHPPRRRDTAPCFYKDQKWDSAKSW